MPAISRFQQRGLYTVSYLNYWGVPLPESNASNNWINGGSGNDQLYGTSANDSFVGNGGTDFMYGGVGDDTYWTPTTIIEQAGQGIDTVRVWVSATLTANVENLVC